MFILLHCQVREQTSKCLHPRWFMHRRLSHLPFLSLANLLTLLILRCSVVYLNLIYFELNHLSTKYWNLSNFFYTWRIIDFLCTAKVTGIQQDDGWCYIGCSGYSKKLVRETLPSHVFHVMNPMLRPHSGKNFATVYFLHIESNCHIVPVTYFELLSFLCKQVPSDTVCVRRHWYNIFPCFWYGDG